MAEEMVARFLGNHCPSTQQLAAFVATRGKDLLPAGALVRILESIHKHGVGSEYEVEEVNVGVMTKGDEHRKEEGDKSKRMTKVDNVGTEDADDVLKEKGMDISGQKETIMKFLAFTNFPEEMRDKMVDTFFEQAN